MVGYLHSRKKEWGAVTIFIVKNYVKIEGEYFYELLPGFIAAFISIIVVSLVTQKPSETTLATFDKAVDTTRSVG